MTKELSSSYYQTLNYLFSKKNLFNLIKYGTTDIYDFCIQKYLNKELFISQTNKELIEKFYSLYKKFYRNEYFYKNTIINKILINKHDLKTTIALNELPIEKSIADFILINGKATVYEIKSEVDKLDRLNSQIENYFKAFPSVYVVTYSKNIKKINNSLQNSNTGIIILDDFDNVKDIKEAKDDFSKLSNHSIFKILRKNEYENIIEKFFGKLPNVSQVRHYRTYLELALQIDTINFYNEALNQLRLRNNINKEFYLEYVPYEIKYPFYFSNIKEREFIKLDQFLSSTYGG